MSLIEPAPHTARDQRALVICLRLLGMIDLLALGAVFMPGAWMAGIHESLGLGDFPESPVAGYLARSTSALYALHGALVLFMSLDVIRYAPLIRWFAVLAVVHGGVMFGIGWFEGMPSWWISSEGPVFAATGIVVLIAAREQPIEDERENR